MTVPHVHGGDLPGLKALMKRLEDQKHSVLIGVPADASRTYEAGETDKPTMVEIAATHEFGDPERNIPERPVLRQGVRNGAKKYTRVGAASLRAVLAGKQTLEQSVELLGVVAVGEVKREFVQPNPAFAPNSPITIARKGSSRPLIDTGQYRQSITFQVEQPGAADAD